MKMKFTRPLEHWVCFDCRKMFKKPSRWMGMGIRRRPEIIAHLCPQCRKEMRDMGKYFEPPRRADVRQWEVMKILANNDLTFHTEGIKHYINHFIVGTARQNAKVVRERINEFRRVSNGEELLKKINQKFKYAR